MGWTDESLARVFNLESSVDGKSNRSGECNPIHPIAVIDLPRQDRETTNLYARIFILSDARRAMSSDIDDTTNPQIAFRKHPPNP